MSFVEKLDEAGLEFFNSVTASTFGEQAVSFLNAYWDEIGSQAEFIFEVTYEKIKYADMHAKGVQYVHKYEEGNDLDFNIGLYFYEILCKFLNEDGKANWTTDQWKNSQPEMQTAIVRKKELRDKVDVNFDGRVSLLEVLLYQYREIASPLDFVTKSMSAPDEHPEIKKARLALEDVNKRIQAYEAEKARLEELAKQPGVKGLGAKNLLAQLDSSPLVQDLNRALITAEAAVRKATKMFGKGGSAVGEGKVAAPNEGALWWMNKDLDTKKKKYGKKK